MKIKFVIAVLFFLMVSAYQTKAQTAYDFSITTMDGVQHSLREYQGKNILITILPAGNTTQDSAYLLTIDSIQKAHADSLKIIGIPSYEDGYSYDSVYQLKSFYDSLIKAPDFVLSQGISTRKTSAYQDPLFAWLTNKNQNGHFDQDVTGAQEKYFINTQGNLYAVIGAEEGLSENLIEHLLDGTKME